MAKVKKVGETPENQSSDSSYTELDLTPDESVSEVIEEEVKELVVEGPKFIQPKSAKVEGNTLEERLLSYLRGRVEFVKINEFLKHEFKHRTEQQIVNKQLKFTLANLVVAGKIIIKDDAHLPLGTFFYAGDNPQTQYRTIENTTIEAKLA